MEDEAKKAIRPEDLDKVSGGAKFSGIPVSEKCPVCGGNMFFIPYIHETICENCG